MNPGIFGDMPGGTNPSLDPLPIFENQLQSPQYDEIQERLEKMRYEWDEWAKSFGLRLERAMQKYGQLDERINFIVKEVNERLAVVTNRLKERAMNEIKVEALIERHNQIVQTFELRINQSQKLIENQALQLAKQQELIDDARRQIEKLKKL